jgi:glycosyltransferase involved in cell wall biosynthesis
MNKVLIITYYWPPSGGAGVQRWLKFSKYLPQFGWEPVILTIDPSYATFPVLDYSLGEDLPGNIEVYRTRATDWFTIYRKDKSKIPSAGFASNPANSLKGKFFRFIRGNFFIPDPRRGWNKFAFRKGCELIENKAIRTIITTSPPHSTQLIGLKLKKKYPHIKWISDLRDPWTDIYYYELFFPTFFSRKIDKYYEKSVLTNADVITTVGDTLAKHFISKVKGLEGKIKTIHNGYDESDFDSVTHVTPEIFTISFTGTISGSYPIDGFLNAVKNVIDKGNRILVRFTGIISEDYKEKITASAGKENVEFIPYADHKRVIIQMMESSLQLLVIAKHSENRSFLSGKLFEYIAAGKPILCLGPVDGDASQILISSGTGKCFPYEDEKGITEYLISCLKEPLSDRNIRPVEYSRKYQAEQMASLF